MEDKNLTIIVIAAIAGIVIVTDIIASSVTYNYYLEKHEPKECWGGK